MKHSLFSLLAASLLSLPALAGNYRVASPNGSLEATITLEDGKLSYSVVKDSHTVVNPSPLGLTTAQGDFSSGLEYVSHNVADMDEPYTLTAGKQLECRNTFAQLTLTLRNPNEAWNMSLLFRMYNDGFAFRYVLPKKGTSTFARITAEESRFCVADFNYCIGSRFNHPDDYYHPNIPYESNIGKHRWNDLQGHGYDRRLNAPALVSTTGGDFILLSEAENVGAYSTAMLRAEKTKGEFSIAYSGDTFDMEEDKPHTLNVTLPLKTPWRMAMVGSLAQVFESVMTESLNAASVIDDTSWIKPGVVAWDWGGVEGGNYLPTRFECDREYVDLAVEMGWPYILIDGGWNRNNLPEVLNYAKSKGIEPILWQTAKLSDSQEFSVSQMANTLNEWKSWGIKGVKIDFWEDDSRTTMNRMELLLKLCAERKMLVNFHGCTRPSGLRRTYPHLMTQEGIMGGEQNFWNNKFMTAEHHINLFYTRNVVGGADYTPGDIVDRNGTFIFLTSVAHRMALLTAFESGTVHIAEEPSVLKYFEGRDIMKRLPTIWDESRLLEGEPSSHATIARRRGEDWWIAGTTVAARTSRLTFDFLPQGKEYTAYIYRDGTTINEMKFDCQKVTAATTLNIPLLKTGGYLIQVSPRADLPTPLPFTTYEAEAPANELKGGAVVRTDDAHYTSGGKQVHDLGKGASLTFKGIKATHGKGKYVLSVYYNTIDDRKAYVRINGGEEMEWTLKGNAKRANTYSGKGMAVYRAEVELNEGDNIIAFSTKANQWSPNIDRITLTPLATEASAVQALEHGNNPVTGPVYNLAGQFVAQRADGFNAQSGIYLMRRADGSFLKKFVK